MSFINVTSALNSNYALAIIFAILAIETGLPLIIGLPGDTLLITAGLFAAGIGVESTGHHINILVVAIGAPMAAIIGSQFGHWLGWNYGVRIFNRPNCNTSPMKVEDGMIKVPTKTYAFWNVLGALIWTQTLIWGGYIVGNTFADTIAKYLTEIILVIAGVTVLPLLWEIFKEWRTRKHLS